MVDTELSSLQKTPSINAVITASSEVELGSADEHRYTSLKDVIVNSPAVSSNSLCYDQYLYDFDPSNIMIRNQLVKHAASVYLQSAVILVSRNQNWFMRFWDKVKSKVVASISCCHVYVCDPLRACFSPLYHSIHYMVGGAFDSMIRT